MKGQWLSTVLTTDTNKSCSVMKRRSSRKSAFFISRNYEVWLEKLDIEGKKQDCSNTMHT